MVKAIVNYYTENTYIINEKQDAFIIDPGAHVDEIKAYIDEQNLDVKGILLTHGHFDHLSSINEVFDLYQCPVYIHELERDFLFDPNLNLSSTISKSITFKHKNMIHTIKDKDTIPLGRQTIKVLHTPGHTRGGVGYLYRRFLFSGDTLFKGTIGRTDLPTSSRVAIERSLQYLIKECKDNTVVYPGHGHFTTILTEKYENPYVQTR